MQNQLIYIYLGISALLSISLWLFYKAINLFHFRFSLNDHDLNLLNTTLLCSSITFIWYSISLFLTLYNKFLLQSWGGSSGFNYPTIMTATHLLVKLMVTRIWKLTIYREAIEDLPYPHYFTMIIPIGLLTCLDIALSNVAITFLPLSIYTILKSSTLIFTFFWGLMFKVEPFKSKVGISVLGIICGLTISMSANTASFQTIGLITALASSAASGMRWVIIKMLIDIDPQSKDVMVTLYRFSPYSALFVVPLACGLELRSLLSTKFISNPTLFVQTSLIVLFGGVIASILIFVEVQLLKITSSLTMGVLGQIKEILQIIVAMILFQDKISWRSGLGISISIAASYCYRYIRVEDTKLATMSSKQSTDSLPNQLELEEMVPLNTEKTNVDENNEDVL